MADREGEVRWDGLCSRDASAREGALENIKQAALKKSEAAALGLKASSADPATAAATEGLLLSAAIHKAGDGLNQMLVRLLMLTKRCPFRDVREKSEAILTSVQVKECILFFLLVRAALTKAFEKPLLEIKV